MTGVQTCALPIWVECAFPERVLNLCGARDLSFWDLEWENAASFTCRMNRRDYATLSRAAETLHCTQIGRASCRERV